MTAKSPATLLILVIACGTPPVVQPKEAPTETLVVLPEDVDAACSKSVNHSGREALIECTRGVSSAVDGTSVAAHGFSSIRYTSSECLRVEKVGRVWRELCSRLRQEIASHNMTVSNELCDDSSIHMTVYRTSGAAPLPASTEPYHVLSAVAVVRNGLSCPVQALQSASYGVYRERGRSVLKSDTFANDLYLTIQESFSRLDQ